MFRLAALVAASFLSPAHGQTGAKPAAQQQAPKQAQIDRNGLLILVRSTLVALDQANKTGNYTVLRDLASPGFASANNPARLAEIFANLRHDRIDLSGVLVLEPQLNAVPDITPQGMMHIAGFFPSAPVQINFEMLFAPVDGQWKLFGIAANLVSSSPVAPAPPPPAASAKPAAPAQAAKKPAAKP